MTDVKVKSGDRALYTSCGTCTKPIVMSVSPPDAAREPLPTGPGKVRMTCSCGAVHDYGSSEFKWGTVDWLQ